ncbi:MAG TPA: sialidase family protein, partial [Tepidisphaeraceae bacterium]|nr:sialidase family protein [Tepidisphaeraceae bacterium]
MRGLTMQHLPLPLLLSLMVAASATSAQQQQGLWIDPRTRSLQIEHVGPFVSTANDGILCVKDDTALISHDNGATCQAHPIFHQRKLRIRPEHALLRTSKDVIVCVFMDDLDKRWNWNQQTNSADGQIWLYVWSIRSLDQGRTWTDLCQIQSGYCGAIRDMIETDAGNLVVPAMRYLPDGARHATVPYISTDQGLTWKETGLLDIGG